MRAIAIPNPFENSSFADTIIRSSDGTEFYVSHCLLAFASPVLARMLSVERASAPNALSKVNTERRMLDLPEDGRTLLFFFQLCYPMQDPIVEDGSIEERLGDVSRLLDASHKYEVPRAAAFASQISSARNFSTRSCDISRLASRSAMEICWSTTPRRKLCDSINTARP